MDFLVLLVINAPCGHALDLDISTPAVVNGRNGQRKYSYCPLIIYKKHEDAPDRDVIH